MNQPVTCLLVDVSEKAGGGDAYLLDLAGKTEGKRVLVLNKVDRIKKPEDLKGKKVGLPEFQLTACVWARAILQDDYGVR